MELSVSLEMVCRLIAHARELEAQSPAIDADEDEDPQDGEDGLEAIDDDAGDGMEAELIALMDDISDDHLAEILALAWVGRGTYDTSEWEEALEEANEPDGEDPIDQLLDMPTLASYLEAGLTAFDLSCEGIGAD